MELTTDEARQRLEHWRLGIEECHQQQLTLQQRIEALRQRQDYLAWQYKGRVRIPVSVR